MRIAQIIAHTSALPQSARETEGGGYGYTVRCRGLEDTCYYRGNTFLPHEAILNPKLGLPD